MPRRPFRRADPPLPEPVGPAIGATDGEMASEIDARLIAAAQAGDLDAFNTLVPRHERAVFNVCLRLLRDVSLAEDAAQETFVRAWMGVKSFRGGLVRPWLLRIATNRCYDLLRERGRRPVSSLDAEPFEIQPTWPSQRAEEESPETFALQTELGVHLERALTALPDDQRLVVLLADVQGCDYQEVAAITGTALGTVKSRLSRARARLREALRDDATAGELFDRYLRLAEERDRAGRGSGEPREATVDDDGTA